MNQLLLLLSVLLSFQTSAHAIRFVEDYADFGRGGFYNNRGFVPPDSIYAPPAYVVPIVEVPVYTPTTVVDAPPPVYEEAPPVYTPPPVVAAPPPAVNTGGCQSETLCVHTNMPTLSQRDTTRYATGGYYENSYNKHALGFDSNQYDMGLLEYVNNRERLNLSYNAGWCGGVAAAMVIKAYAVDKGGAPAINLADPSVNSFTYNVMKLVETNLRKGGTSDGGVRQGFRRIAGSASAASLSSVNQFNATKPYLYVNLNDEHAVAVNGTDGGYFIVYDPHGRIFSAQVAGRNLQWVKNSAGSQSPAYSNIRIESVIKMGQ